jgi:hypothetical protein
MFTDRKREDSAGKIAIWAYSLTKIAQCLIENNYAIKGRLFLAGHSRLGKTALLATAQCEFFSGVLSNCSGCGGAAIYREKQGEDIELDSGEILPNDKITYRPYGTLSYAYCSDTNYSARLARMVEGVDMLYHEATYAAAEKKLAKERGHSTTADAAKVAQMAGAGRLLIGHFSSRYKNLEELCEESRTIFPNTDIAREGERFTIEPRRHDKS